VITLAAQKKLNAHNYDQVRRPGGQFGYTLPSRDFDMATAYSRFRALLMEMYK
jgi:hypothetical protein